MCGILWGMDSDNEKAVLGGEHRLTNREASSPFYDEALFALAFAEGLPKDRDASGDNINWSIVKEALET